MKPSRSFASLSILAQVSPGAAYRNLLDTLRRLPAARCGQARGERCGKTHFRRETGAGRGCGRFPDQLHRQPGLALLPSMVSQASRRLAEPPTCRAVSTPSSGRASARPRHWDPDPVPAAEELVLQPPEEPSIAALSAHTALLDIRRSEACSPPDRLPPATGESGSRGPGVHDPGASQACSASRTPRRGTRYASAAVGRAVSPRDRHKVEQVGGPATGEPSRRTGA